MRPSLIVKIDSIHDMNNVVSDALHKFSDTKEEFLYNYIDKNRNVKLEELTFVKPVSGHDLPDHIRQKAIEEFDLSFDMENNIITVEKEYLFFIKDLNQNDGSFYKCPFYMKDGFRR